MASERRWYERWLSALDRIAQRERGRIVRIWNSARRRLTEDVAERALRSGDLEPLAGQIGLPGAWVDVRTELARGGAAGMEAAAALERARSWPLFSRGIEVTWEAVRPRAIAWLRRHSASLVTEISADQLDALRTALANAATDGLTSAAASRSLSGVLGLDSRRTGALENFRRRLGRAVDRERITPRRAGYLFELYRARLLRDRWSAVTQTETGGAMNQATIEIWSEARRRGALASIYGKSWVGILGDGKICPICYGLHGKTVALDRPFISAIIGEIFRPGAHTRCRCVLRLQRLGEATEDKPPYKEPVRGRGLKPMV